MNVLNWKLRLLSCWDSDEIAGARQRELTITPETATLLGKSAIEATQIGYYVVSGGRQVKWSSLVESAIASKISIAPDDPLPNPDPRTYLEMRVQVANETTLMASRRLVDKGSKPLALNFANGVQPGGGFLCLRQLAGGASDYESLLPDVWRESHPKSIRDYRDAEKTARKLTTQQRWVRRREARVA